MKAFEITAVLLYNLILLAGASYLVAVHDFSWWIFFLALLFGASWSNKDGQI